jgi:hypothetical protein
MSEFKSGRYYLGHKRVGRNQLLLSHSTPTESMYGAEYFAFTGPFRTKRAALWALKYGENNPHFQHVNDAERLSK